MKYILLSIFLFATTFAWSKDTYPADSSAVTENAYAPAGSFATSNFAAPPRRAREGSSVHLMMDVFLGDFIPKVSEAGVKGKGAVEYGGEIGVNIQLRSRNSNVTNLLYIGGYFAGIHIKEQATNNGTTTTTVQNTGVFGVPVTFTKIGGGDGGGLYWEAGANIGHIYTATVGSTDMMKHYNSIFIEPTIGVGISIPFEMTNRRNGNVVTGKLLIGPYFSYMATNLSQDNGVGLHGYSFGLMYREAFL